MLQPLYPLRKSWILPRQFLDTVMEKFQVILHIILSYSLILHVVLNQAADIWASLCRHYKYRSKTVGYSMRGIAWKWRRVSSSTMPLVIVTWGRTSVSLWCQQSVSQSVSLAYPETPVCTGDPCKSMDVCRLNTWNLETLVIWLKWQYVMLSLLKRSAMALVGFGPTTKVNGSYQCSEQHKILNFSPWTPLVLSQKNVFICLPLIGPIFSKLTSLDMLGALCWYLFLY